MGLHEKIELSGILVLIFFHGKKSFFTFRHSEHAPTELKMFQLPGPTYFGCATEWIS